MAVWNLNHTLILAGAVALCAGILSTSGKQQLQQENRFQRIAYALEAYALDNGGAYPPPLTLSATHYLHPVLTTPVAYLQPSDMVDPFAEPGPRRYLKYVNFDIMFGQSADEATQAQYPHYLARHGSWLVWSGSFTSMYNPETKLLYDPRPFDATNGTQQEITGGTPFTGSFRSQRIMLEIGHSTP